MIQTQADTFYSPLSAFIDFHTVNTEPPAHPQRKRQKTEVSDSKDVAEAQKEPPANELPHVNDASTPLWR